MKNGLIAATEKLLSRAAHALEHHPRQVTALVAALLLCGGGGAFAVASLDPDPSGVPVREVLEAVTPLPVQEQLQALEVHQLNLFRSDYTRANDTAESLLARLGVDDALAAAFIRSEPKSRAMLLGRGGRAVTAEASDGHALNRLTVRWAAEDDGNFRRLVIERGADGQFSSHTEVAPLVAAVRLGSATVQTSLFAAADESRIPDAVISQFVKIFSGDIDFHRALQRGDRFNVVYEALEADGEPIRTGRVLSVEFMNKGKLHQATWFQEPGGKGAYYTPDGKSLETSYLASPMEFSRVTSSFSMRFHPILHQWKAHLGTDYGAATGTPVRSVGDGVVEFAGVQNGFGKVVIVRHNNTDQTLYAHLSRINVKPGQRIAQGFNVGNVGSTGWATGPHLHFEYRVNGAHQPPQMMAKRSVAEHLSAAAKPEFDRVSRAMRVQLEAAASAGKFASAN